MVGLNASPTTIKVLNSGNRNIELSLELVRIFLVVLMHTDPYCVDIYIEHGSCGAFC